MRKLPTLAEFIGRDGRKQDARPQTSADIMNTMRQWRVAQAFAEPPHARRGSAHGQ